MILIFKRALGSTWLITDCEPNAITNCLPSEVLMQEV